MIFSKLRNAFIHFRRRRKQSSSLGVAVVSSARTVQGANIHVTLDQVNIESILARQLTTPQLTDEV